MNRLLRYRYILAKARLASARAQLFISQDRLQTMPAMELSAARSRRAVRSIQQHADAAVRFAAALEELCGVLSQSVLPEDPRTPARRSHRVARRPPSRSK